MKQINGIVSAPASKSMTQRAFACALFGKRTVIRNASDCDDAKTALGIISTLGAKVHERREKIVVEGIRAEHKTKKNRKIFLNCNESGFCIRAFSAIAGVFDSEIVLNAKGSLLQRPLGMIEEPLKKLGAECVTMQGKAPVNVKGSISAGTVTIDGAITSQFLSGILIALTQCEKDSKISVKNLKSKGYVEMTMQTLKEFGAEIKTNNEFNQFFVKGNQKLFARNHFVEGDWSSAAFLLTAGAIGGKITVKNLHKKTKQPDARIIEVLKNAGAEITWKKNGVTAKKNNLNAFEFDVNESPDLFPVTCVLACACKGKSIIHGTERLMHKESNRAKIMALELKKIGGKVKLKKNSAEITGCALSGGCVDSHKDHRIAMALKVAEIISEKKIEVKNTECVSKSFPGFFETMKKMEA
jgi:3-phosphoshikimate 1-carboxyvinyltransferase